MSHRGHALSQTWDDPFPDDAPPQEFVRLTLAVLQDAVRLLEAVRALWSRLPVHPSAPDGATIGTRTVLA